jgi:hypothetical protein
MKAAQLEEARAALAARKQNAALHDRLLAGEPLRLTIGSGSNLAEIVLSAAYERDIRLTLIGAFSKRIAANDADLERLGVEP